MSGKRRVGPIPIVTVRGSFCDKCKRFSVCTYDNGYTHCMIHEPLASEGKASFPMPVGPNPVLPETANDGK